MCVQLKTILQNKGGGGVVWIILWNQYNIIKYMYLFINIEYRIVCMVFSGHTSSLPQKPLYQNFVAKGERWGISGKQKKDRLIIE